MVRISLVTLVLVLLWAASAGADTLYLKNGKTYEGNLVSDRGGMVKFKTRFGILEFPKSQVDRIVEGRTAIDEYNERLGKVDKENPRALLELVRWCEEAGLAGQRRKVLRMILKVCPDHPTARRASRQVWLGKWVKAPKSLPERKIVPAARKKIPETRASFTPPTDWKTETADGRAQATGPARYRVAPVLTIEFGGAGGDPEESFPEKEGWAKPKPCEAAGLTGLRSRRTVTRDHIDRTERMAVLQGDDGGITVRLTALAMEAGEFDPALEMVLLSIRIAARPADYTNKHYHYSLNLPKPPDKWVAEEDDENDLSISHNSTDPTGYAFMYIVAGKPGEEETGVRESFDEMVAGMKTAGDLKETAEKMIAGEKARFVDGTYLADGVPVRTRCMLFTHKKLVYLIYFTQHEFGTKKTDEAWDIVMKSFRFTK